MSGEMAWYVARTGGFLAWALSAFSILWGLLITSRALGKRISGPRLLDLHRFVGGLSLVFVGVHLLGLRLHEFEKINFGFKELFIPMASDWHPGAVAYGIVAFYLLVAVEITSLLRRRIPSTIWRRVHYSGFVVFLLGSIHALKVGTDVQNPLIWWPSALVCAAIVGLGVTRAMAAAQEASGKTADREVGPFGTTSLVDPPVDQWAAPAAPIPPAPRPEPIVATGPRPEPLAAADQLAAAVAATTSVDDRAALLERTRRSLERLDITAYPRAELPAELLTTRPVQASSPSAQPEHDEAALPTRPTTDIALRYARLRNPSNPQAAPPPSFQAVIPPGANSQSNWGQPPAGWDAPSSQPMTVAPPEQFAPAPLAVPTYEPAPFEQVVEPVVAAPAVVEPTTYEPAPYEPAPYEPALFEPTTYEPVAEFVAEPAAEIAQAPAAVGLPDPNSRTAWEDQLAPQVSSLDWRSPGRSADATLVTTPVEPTPEAEFGGAAEPANVRNGLPSRTPQRLARSTQPARNPLDWKPQRVDTAPMGGAPPPPTPDPATGEVPSEQYRVWLREWLAFAESYDG